MIKFFHKYLRQLALGMTAVIINLSVDAPDYGHFVNLHYTYADDLSVNEVESISEWVLEHVFDITDAVPESDDDEATSFSKTTVDYLFFSSHHVTSGIPTIQLFIPKAVHIYTPSFWLCDAVMILIQPPKL